MKLADCGYDNRHALDFEINRPKGFDYYLIIVIRSPSYVYISNDLYNTKGNCLVLLRNNTPHRYGPNKEEFVNDFVQFTADEKDVAFFERLGIQFDTLTEFQNVYPLSDYMKKIVAERWSKNANAEESIDHLIRLLLLKISDYHVAQPMEKTELTEHLTMLRHNLFTTPQKNWTVEGIAKSLSISPSYLHYKYKQLFDSTVKKDIILFRLEYSKQLLSSTNHSIYEIAHKSGFENDVHFMRIFKKHVGCTPTQYRKSKAVQEQTPVNRPQDSWTTIAD